MVKYYIEMTEEAKEDLYYFTPYERKLIISNIRAQLVHQPRDETKNRKKLRDNPVAPMELRSGKIRIFYEVNENSQMVSILAVGYKEHNILRIRGKEVKL
ncbi:MAG: type II toxin-antitoxin system RelE/ParE family toxin [Candidatus Omnitrophota bacterium]|jgi:mRNA-degrading endonuclease RelE of RelBE toxin-antitoxin system|nr:MAG: type II toxin-antitoxin system RelE/ParE family toxin [Candidatus Omnitrophota bacterium]